MGLRFGLVVSFLGSEDVIAHSKGSKGTGKTMRVCAISANFAWKACTMNQNGKSTASKAQVWNETSSTALDVIRKIILAPYAEETAKRLDELRTHYEATFQQLEKDFEAREKALNERIQQLENQLYKRIDEIPTTLNKQIQQIETKIKQEIETKIKQETEKKTEDFGKWLIEMGRKWSFDKIQGGE